MKKNESLRVFIHFTRGKLKCRVHFSVHVFVAVHGVLSMF